MEGQPDISSRASALRLSPARQPSGAFAQGAVSGQATAQDGAQIIEIVNSKRLADDTTLVLSRVQRGSSGVSIQSAGSAHAGCQYTAYNALGFAIYSFTIWQDFSYNNGVITSFPSEATSSVAYWGWSLTSSSSSHWWVVNPSNAAARGSYVFTQYVAGRPFQSRSGYVQVNIFGTGTWSCSSS